MPAPKGNQYWKLNPNPGSKPAYTEADLPEFIEKINTYFETIINNPLQEEVIIKAPSEIVEMVEVKDPKDRRRKILVEKVTKLPYTRTTISKQIPFTWEGVAIALGITAETLREYRKRKAFAATLTHVGDIIYKQKYEGAAAGFFQQNIIARDLGLIERRSNNNTNKTLGNRISVKIVE